MALMCARRSRQVIPPLSERADSLLAVAPQSRRRPPRPAQASIRRTGLAWYRHLPTTRSPTEPSSSPAHGLEHEADDF